MSKIVCNIVTPAVEELAKKFGKSAPLTNIIISAWQTENQTIEYPTIEQLKEYYKSRHSQNDISSMRINHSDDFARLTRDFSPFVLHDRATAIARTFSDIVSRGVEEKLAEIESRIVEEQSKETPNQEELGRLYDKRQEYNGPQARHAVIRDMTVKNIFDQIREEYMSYLDMTAEELDADFGEGKGAYMLNEYAKVLNNFPALLNEACILLENTEHIRVTADYHEFNDGENTTEVIGGSIQEASDITEDTENQFSDDEDGERATGNDGWSFQVRFVDPYTTLSKGVKEVLSNIIRVDNNGNPDVDDLGNVRYLNPEYTHVALLNSMSSIVDPDDFSILNSDGSYSFPALERASAKYPWISQVINALQSNPTLIGSFYADLRKDFIPYWHQFVNDKGVLVTHALNQNTALESSLNAAQGNYAERQQLDVDSLYTKKGAIDVAKATIGETLAANTLTLTRDFDEDDIETITKNVSKMVKMLGFDVNAGAISNLLQSVDGVSAVEAVVNAARSIFQGSKDVDPDSNLFEQFGDSYKIIAENIGVVEELDNIASFRQGDKTRYSYSTPNYVDTMIKMFKDNDRRTEYLESEFGQFEWFKKNGRWRSGWLAQIEEDEDVRYQMSTKEVIDINGAEYSNWRPMQIRRAFVNEFFSQGINTGSQKQFAWYNMPIFSDSPVVKFIRFTRYTGDFKAQITPLLRDVVKQELYRINLVKNRRANGVAQIQNFDKNGDKFHFFPELNEGDFLQQAEELINNKDGQGLNTLIDNAVTGIMDSLFVDFLRNQEVGGKNIHTDNLLAQGVIQDASQTEAALEEYFWNQAYATTQIIELTTTDLAFYKDDVDFQKRYKEVYASGTKLNTNTKYGKKARRTVYLADNIITSTTFNDIREALNVAVANGQIQSFDRDNILDKFKDVNIADAQAYITPQTMRSVLDMMGAWTDDMEQSLERFESGQWDMSDFNTLWQTIKPFVYTQISKPDGVTGKRIKVPHQNKNSEYLLLAAYQMVASSTGKSGQLRALQNFMRDNDIDVIQFQSAVKAGGQGIIDINYSESKLNKWFDDHNFEGERTFKNFKESLDKQLERGTIGQEEYNKAMRDVAPAEQETYAILEKYAKRGEEFNPESVHEIPYRDYVIQQPTPEHLIDAEGVFGSQLRNLIVADLPDNFELTMNGVKLDKKGVVSLYQSLIVENLLENYNQLTQRFQDIHSLQKALMSQVKGNVKYSRDMINALQIVESVNPITGQREEVFNMPLNNPSVTLKLQELVNSMFKNAIAKQYIKGGNAILVSNFGLTQELNLVYEGEGQNKRLAGIECYLPASSRKFYAPFMKTSADGSYQYLDVERLPKELRKLIGYRIPTEDKYSMAPLIVKGFLPQQNGSAIMLPADITQIAGSDFDVDKMFLMIPEFKSIQYDYGKARRDYEAIRNDDAVTKLLRDIFVDNTEVESAFEELPEDFREWFKSNKEKYKYETPRIVKIKYDTKKSAQENSRAQRNNMLIDIIYGILTHPSTASKILNPGNFDTVKLQARITRVITDPEMYEAFKAEFGISSREGVIKRLLQLSKKGDLETLDNFLKKYRRTRSQLTLETFVYNHVQNMTGAALIGMYANNTTAQAKYQYSSLALKDDAAFVINGRRVQSLHDVVSPLGERISRNCAQFSAASVDNVKDPVLADLLQNVNTARVAGFMLRAGMSIEEISLLFAQPIVRDCILETGSLAKLNDYIRGAYSELKRQGGGVDLNVRLHEFTSEELMNNVLASYEELGETESKELTASNIQSALLMEHIASLADVMAELTQISRADSPNGAILNTIAGAKMQVARVTRFNDRAKAKNFPFVGVSDALQNGLVTENSSLDSMRETFMRRKMPMLQAFYSLGIELGTQTMGKYFQQINPYSDIMLNKILANAPAEFLSNMNQRNAVRVINSFYRDLVNFSLSNTKIFGDDDTQSFEEKRDYYLTMYPTEFLAAKDRNPEIAKLGLIKKLTVKNGKIQLLRSGRMRQQARDAFMRDMDALLYMGDEGIKMASDLFKYAYYSEGFWFGPNSFGNFFSTNFFNTFPEVVSNLRYMKSTMIEGSIYDRFLPQFYANHYLEGIIPTVSSNETDKQEDAITESNDGAIFVPTKKSFNRTTNDGEYPYIIYKGQLYHLSSRADFGGKTTYRPVTTLNTPKYNANMTVDEMKQFDTEQKSEFDSFEDFFNGPSDADWAELESQPAPEDLSTDMATLDDPSIAQGFDEYMQELANFDEFSGEQTLKQPLCK